MSKGRGLPCGDTEVEREVAAGLSHGYLSRWPLTPAPRSPAVLGPPTSLVGSGCLLRHSIPTPVSLRKAPTQDWTLVSSAAAEGWGLGDQGDGHRVGAARWGPASPGGPDAGVPCGCAMAWPSDVLTGKPCQGLKLKPNTQSTSAFEITKIKT